MAKAMRYFICTIERETEKAILAKYIYDVDIMDPERAYSTTVWLPKSQIQEYKRFLTGDRAVIYKVPLWLCNKNGLATITKKMADEVDINKVEGVDFVMA